MLILILVEALLVRIFYRNRIAAILYVFTDYKKDRLSLQRYRLN